MQTALLITFFICFTFLSFTRFNLALSILFLLLPTYLIDFSIGPIPTDMLEVMLGLVVLAWLVKKRKKIIKEVKQIYKRHRWLVVGVSLFVLGATISIFNGLDPISALGEWKSFYIEPIILAAVLTTSLDSKEELKNILFAIVVSGFAVSILAVYQHFTGFLVPYSFWENNNAFRVTAWYGFPNAVGHFLAPAVIIASYLVYDQIRTKPIGWLDKIKHFLYSLPHIFKKNNKPDRTKKETKNTLILTISLLAVPSGLLGIIFAKSTGALMGVLGGLGVLLLFSKWRWWAVTLGVVGIIGVFLLPRGNNIRQELLLQNRTGQLRIDMYQQTFEFIEDQPVFGAGISAYKQKIIPYRDNPNVEVFHHPHNLWLTIWVNLGIVGLIGFVWVLFWFYYFVGPKEKYEQIKTQQELKLLATSIFTTFLVMGLVDSPYIKDDLALLFWFPIALALLSERINSIS
ncbi:MAG: O-antigen ligase family protein [Candidatus Magasanikbacteria bacterium]